jgi:sugar phosphate isomerase/epimerase
MTAKGKSWVIVTVDSTAEEVQTMAQEAKQRGLQILSIFGGDFPVSRSIEAGIEGLKKLIDYCVVCSCPNLLLGGTTEEKFFEPYYKVVAECCDYAKSRKVGLSIKPHGGQNATGPQCRRIIERLGRKEFRLWYDPGNIFYYSDGSLNPVEDARTVDGLVAGMSVKDFLPPKEVLVTPGTGKVDFREVMARLRQGGFRSGPMLVECLAKRDTAAAVTAEAIKTLKFLQGLLDSKN